MKRGVRSDRRRTGRHSDTGTTVSGRGGAWLPAAALVVATFAAYQPAWRGLSLWDDAAHMTRAGLQSLAGLKRIWLEPGATQQYYPLTHTAFWIENRLWGSDTLGYHLAGIAFHLVPGPLQQNRGSRV